MTPEIESKVRFHLGVHQAWENSDYYRRDAQHDARGAEDELPCPCDSGLSRDECHNAGPCYFQCRCPEQEGAA